VITGLLAEIADRKTSAKIVDPQTQPRDEVRFGATVTLLTLSGKNPGQERRVTIVRVDEAEPSAGRISFIAPIARAIQGCQVGETTTLRTARGGKY
jgi:transcription elongation factor GreB